MDIQQAIETLKNLPPERREHLIRQIESESELQPKSAAGEKTKPYAWAEFLLQHPIDTDRTDLSQNKAAFLGNDDQT